MANTLEIVINAKDNASGVLDKVSGKVSSFGSGLTAALRPAAMAGAAVAGAIAGIGVVAAKTFGPMIDAAREFEGAVVNMGIASSGAGLGLDELEAAALAVGMDTRLMGVTAAGAADSITAMFKAGLTATEVFGDLDGYMAGTAELGGALRAAIDLAAASELDMVQASDLAAIALSTFGGDMETEAERAAFVNSAMDNMVKAANASVSSVSDLADSMSTAGPIFAMYGFSLEDTNNALAILSTRGIKGAEAGTSLKSMLVNMTSTTKSTAEAWASLGLSMYDSEGNMRELPDIIGDLNTAMAGYTEEQRNATLVALAGSYGIKALSTLVGEGAAGWYEMKDATAAAMGMASQAALKINTLGGAQEVLGGIMETLKIQIGQAFLPAIKDLTVAFAGLAEKYGPQVIAMFRQLGEWLSANLPGMIQGAIAWFDNLLLGLQPIIAWITAFVQEHGPMLKEAFIGIAAVLAAFVAAGTIAAITLLLTQLANPISLVAAGIALLAVAWTRDWGGIRTTLMAAWEAIQPTLQIIADWLSVKVPAAVNWMRDAIGAALAFIQGLFATHEDEVTGTVSGLWATVTNAFTVALDFVKGVVSGALEAIRAWWDQHGANVLLIVNALWASVQEAFEAAKTAVTTIITTLVAVMTGLWNEFKDELLAIVTAMWTLVQAAFETAKRVLGGIVDAIAAVITGDWTALGEALRVITDAMWGFIKTSFETGWETLATVVTGIVDALKGQFTDIDWGSVGRGIIDGIKGGISNAAGSLANAAKSAAENALGAVKGFLGIGSPSKVFMGIGKNMMQGWTMGIQENARGPAMAAAGVSAGVTGAVTNTTMINYNLSANYGYQSERTLAQDVRMLAMLAGG